MNNAENIAVTVASLICIAPVALGIINIYVSLGKAMKKTFKREELKEQNLHK